MEQHFSNFEIFSSVISCYDIEIHQIDRGVFSSVLQQLQYDDVFINRFTSTRRMEVNGSPPPGLITFGIPTAKCQPFTWRNQDSSGNTIQIYQPCTELEMITYPLFEAIDVSITEEKFNILCQLWGFPELNELINQREMVICNPDIMQQLRNILQTICITVNNKPDLVNYNTDLQNLISYRMPYLLVQALQSADSSTVKKSPAKQNHALKTTIDYIQATPHDEISLSKLCLENDINERTLQRAFLSKYGVSPKYYIQTKRLNGAHKILTNNDVATSNISEIANKFGFWHMGQFAKDYQRHFGELPSETLKVKYSRELNY